MRSLRRSAAICRRMYKCFVVEWELSDTMARATWGAMESLEGTVADLGLVPPPWKHASVELDVMLGCLRRA